MTRSFDFDKYGKVTGRYHFLSFQLVTIVRFFFVHLNLDGRIDQFGLTRHRCAAVV